MAATNEQGPTGRAVAANLRRLRGSTSYAELSRRLDEIGWPIAVLGLSRIEKGQRRVDVDDLMALAAALDVSPATLLMPTTGRETEPVSATGYGDLAASELWGLLTAQFKATHTGPDADGWETYSTDMAWLVRSLPQWPALVRQAFDRQPTEGTDHGDD